MTGPSLLRPLHAARGDGLTLLVRATVDLTRVYAALRFGEFQRVIEQVPASVDREAPPPDAATVRRAQRYARIIGRVARLACAARRLPAEIAGAAPVAARRRRPQ